MTEHDEHWRWAVAPAATSAASATPPASAVGASTVGASLAGPGATAAPAVLRARDRWRAAVADRLPPTLQGRWALDRRTGMVLAVSVLIAALLIGGWAVLRSRPHELAVARSGRPSGADAGAGPQAAPGDSPGHSPIAQEPPGIGLGTGALPNSAVGAAQDPASGGGSGLGSGAGSGGAGVVVDVEGRVARPGVRTLPAGSRVVDALTAAGGALPGTDLSPLDQARVLVDGEQVLVGVTPPPGAPATTAPGRGGGKGKGGKAGDGAAEPVHLNSAAVEDLEQLPGIGPALAQRIVDYRTAHGPFHSVEDLRQVSGFGGQRYLTLAPMLAL
ncbi:MAG TPA: ComEA family DNA-binding protein [Actinospica sp.]|jgi:competence protein ComEA|nr:ComEA family DNA-binding protein [Actinospica sp.]